MNDSGNGVWASRAPTAECVPSGEKEAVAANHLKIGARFFRLPVNTTIEVEEDGYKAFCAYGLIA
jgi:hypothetical protein